MFNLKNYEKTYKNFSWDQAKKEISFFGKKLNIAYNSIDRNAEKNGEKIALYWEGEKESKSFTFNEMREQSNKFANVLKKYGIKKGDRVFIFLPRIPELYISFFGILKTGAIAGTLFSAFGEKGIEERLKKGEVKFLITNRELKKRVDKVKKNLPDLKYIILVDGKEGKKIIDYKKEMKNASEEFSIAKMNPDDPALMLFTSSTSNTPIAGIVIPHKAIIQQHITAKWALDFNEDDIYWCTADPGWVTGVVYSMIANWSNNITSVVYEGRFDADRWYGIIEKYKVNVLYTAPTAIRMLKSSNAHKKYDLSSVRHICSVGEALDPDSIKWSMKVFKTKIYENYWQTETGAMIIGNFRCLKIKPGSMGKPFPGVVAKVVDEKGKILPSGKEGNIAIKPNIPAIMIDVWKNRRMYNSYFRHGWYYTGDRAYMDRDGYFFFVGRADDIIKTSGERVGPFEVESALMEHPAINEAAVIGKPDPIRGEIIKAFIVLQKGYKPSKKLEEDIQKFVKKRLAGHAYPREFQFVDSLPKTHSGKIMRRLLKAKELGLPAGDLSSLEK